MRPFGVVNAIGYHQEKTLLRLLINPLKYNRISLNAVPLAALLWGEVKSDPAHYSSYDIIAPVPRTEGDVRASGNPLATVVDIAGQFLESTGLKGISERFALAEDQILSKDIETGKSPDLPPSAKRRKARRILQGVEPNPYSVLRPDAVSKSKILVIDDVFTSGYHTMFPVGHALMAVGAASVNVLVLGRRKWRY